MARVLTVGAAQLGPIQKEEDRTSVVNRMLALVEAANDKGCDLIVFTELSLTTFFPRWYMEDQAEVDQIDRDLGVEHGAHLFPDHGFDIVVARAFGQAQRFRRLLADSVGVFTGDANQVAGNIDRKRAAQRLRDIAVCTHRDFDCVTRRDQNGFTVALEGYGFIGGHLHGAIPALMYINIVYQPRC